MSRPNRSRNPNARPSQNPTQPQPPAAKVTDIKPPAWRTRWSNAADLGYPGFDPPRPGQPEDTLTEHYVKNGYTFVNTALGNVANDSFSAHGLIYGSLKPSRNRSALALLGDLMSAVLKYEPSLRRASPWLADLSNPTIPLSKLAKTVLHVAKGPDLLDMLHANNVAISRAVWYVRILGANETLSIKSRPNYNPAQLAIEWAGTVTTHLKKQLQEIVLPSAPRPGLPIKSTFKSTLTQADTKAKWVSRFAYCVELMRAFYVEHMVDHGAVLSWLSAQVLPANIAQFYFVLRLVEEYLDDIAQHRLFAQPVIEGCLAKLVEVESSVVPDVLTSLASASTHVLHRLFLLNPDYFVCGRIWAQPSYRRLLQTSFQDRMKLVLGEHKSDAEVLDTIGTFAGVAARNDGLLFRLLNSIGPGTDLSCASYFQPDGSDDQKLSVLLTWAVTPSQYGSHRRSWPVPFLQGDQRGRDGKKEYGDGLMRDEVRAVGIWENDKEEGVSTSAGIDDASKIMWHSRDAVALLVGELIEKGLFSYGWQGSNLENQMVRAVLQGVAAIIIRISGTNEPWTSTTLTSLERYLSAGRYILMLAINDWLLATVHQSLDQGLQMSSDTFSRIVQILSARKCFSSIAELIFAVLQSPHGLMNEIGEELFKKHQALHLEHKHCRSLFTLLGSLSSAGSLPESAHHQIESEVNFITQSLHPQTDGTVDPSLSSPQIKSLVNDIPLEQVVIIADDIWYKHHALESWATGIWDHVFASLCTVPQTTPDSQKSEIASRYVTFLVKLSSHSISGLDAICGSGSALYPTWSLASGLSEPRPAVSRLAGLANDLAERLLVVDDVPPAPSLLPPSTLSEVLELSARRLPASNNATFLDFINKFPCLVAMEIQPHIEPEVQASSLPGHKSSPVIDRVKQRPILTKSILGLEQDSSRAEAKERLADFSSSFLGELPSLETNIKDDFLSALQTALEAVLLTWKQPDHSVEPRRPEVATLIARLNQFALGFPDSGQKEQTKRLPSLETNIKDDFLSALQTALEAVLLTWKQPDHSVEPRRPEVATLIARLNQFALGFPEFWTKGTNEKGEALIVVYLQMMKLVRLSAILLWDRLIPNLVGHYCLFVGW
ncbi:mediator complex subunit Med12 [Rhizoctonia solani]|uniref:Mediator of RNA polymerase II transcription subunit 12 n=1 Tax=Rhizoctonia solani TaxID=456999 RepID=A0A8H8SXE0_9AGAM|nr:mediator complex subunit Med12 [Rhizoctonia solani]QRW21284.1 mediator complex subunit Med12 [Rhizoctonia solani]